MRAEHEGAGFRTVGRVRRAGRGTAALLSLALVVPTLLLASPASAATAAPWVTSDKPDYAPGSAVVLSGGDWQPGERVHVNVDEDQTKTWTRDVGREPALLRRHQRQPPLHRPLRDPGDRGHPLAVPPVAGSYAGPVTLTATLRVGGVALSGRSVAFQVDGVDAGTAATDSSGVATVLTTLGATAPGIYPTAIKAAFGATRRTAPRLAPVGSTWPGRSRLY